MVVIFYICRNDGTYLCTVRLLSGKYLAIGSDSIVEPEERHGGLNSEQFKKKNLSGARPVLLPEEVDKPGK